MSGMDKYEKRLLEYFLNKGRGGYAEAHVLEKEAKIPLKKLGDVLGSCIDRQYLRHSPNAKGSKFDQYGLTETGLGAIDEEILHSKGYRYQKIGIAISVVILAVAVMTLLKT